MTLEEYNKLNEFTLITRMDQRYLKYKVKTLLNKDELTDIVFSIINEFVPNEYQNSSQYLIRELIDRFICPELSFISEGRDTRNKTPFTIIE